MEEKRSQGRDILTLITNIASIAVMIVSTVDLIRHYAGLPAQIAMRADAAGNITKYGTKGTLIIMLVMTWLMYGVVSMIGLIPKFMAHGSAASAKTDHISRIVAQMMGIMKLLVVLGFGVLLAGASRGIPAQTWIFVLFILVVTIPLLIMVMRIGAASREP